MEKYFIITVDTESDNQWDINKAQTTNNARSIPRFQELCQKYGFKPVYLVDYSMAGDGFLLEYLNQKNIQENSEVGMHLHAWDTPPEYLLKKKFSGRPYLIEYPDRIMKEKVQMMTGILENNFQRKMYSHRAGRWAINQRYIELLEENGYECDCSVTPGISWRKTKGETVGGVDYSNYHNEIEYWSNSNIVEIPMTVKKLYGSHICKDQGLQRRVKDTIRSVTGKSIWFRPALFGNEDLKRLVEHDSQGYLEMMVHSSELMPNGSPYFTTPDQIENLYENLENLFLHIQKKGYVGATMKEINDIYRGRSKIS